MLNNIVLENAVRNYLVAPLLIKDFVYLQDACTNEFFIRAVDKQWSSFTDIFGYTNVFDYEHQSINANVEKLKKTISNFLEKVPCFNIILREPLHGDSLSRHEGEVRITLKDEYKDKLEEVVSLLRIQNILTGEEF